MMLFTMELKALSIAYLIYSFNFALPDTFIPSRFNDDASSEEIPRTFFNCSKSACKLMQPNNEVITCRESEPPAENIQQTPGAGLRLLNCIIDKSEDEIIIGNKESLRRLKEPSFSNVLEAITDSTGYVPKAGRLSLTLKLNLMELTPNLFQRTGLLITKVHIMNLAAIHPDALIDLRRLHIFEVSTGKVPSYLEYQGSESLFKDDKAAYVRLRPLDGTLSIGFNLPVSCIRCPRVHNADGSEKAPVVIVKFPISKDSADKTGRLTSGNLAPFTTLYPYSCPIDTVPYHEGCDKPSMKMDEFLTAHHINGSLNDTTNSSIDANSKTLPPLGDSWKITMEPSKDSTDILSRNSEKTENNSTYFITVLVLAIWCTILSLCMCLGLLILIRKLRNNGKRNFISRTDVNGDYLAANEVVGPRNWFDRLLSSSSQRELNDEFISASTNSAYLPTTAGQQLAYAQLFGDNKAINNNNLPHSNTAMMLDSLMTSSLRGPGFAGDPSIPPIGSLPNLHFQSTTESTNDRNSNNIGDKNKMVRSTTGFCSNNGTLLRKKGHLNTAAATAAINDTILRRKAAIAAANAAAAAAYAANLSYRNSLYGLPGFGAAAATLNFDPVELQRRESIQFDGFLPMAGSGSGVVGGPDFRNNPVAGQYNPGNGGQDFMNSSMAAAIFMDPFFSHPFGSSRYNSLSRNNHRHESIIESKHQVNNGTTTNNNNSNNGPGSIFSGSRQIHAPLNCDNFSSHFMLPGVNKDPVSQQISSQFGYIPSKDERILMVVNSASGSQAYCPPPQKPDLPLSGLRQSQQQISNDCDETPSSPVDRTRNFSGRPPLPPPTFNKKNSPTVFNRPGGQFRSESPLHVNGHDSASNTQTSVERELFLLNQMYPGAFDNKELLEKSNGQNFSHFDGFLPNSQQAKPEGDELSDSSSDSKLSPSENSSTVRQQTVRQLDIESQSNSKVTPPHPPRYKKESGRMRRLSGGKSNNTDEDIENDVFNGPSGVDMDVYENLGKPVSRTLAKRPAQLARDRWIKNKA